LLSTESVVPFLNQEEIVKFRDVVRSIPDNCYLEWSLSKLGNLYFYEYSKLNPQSVERPYPKSSLLLAEGVGASPGVAFGTIRHVSSFSHDLGIGPEDIIVVSSAGPEILRFINVVAGVVSERGGVTSHGAVIAREFGRPFIVQVENAFQVLKDGTPVIVDGSLGKIMRDEEAVNRRIA